jgi:hypothetical protein
MLQLDHASACETGGEEAQLGVISLHAARIRVFETQNLLVETGCVT